MRGIFWLAENRLASQEGLGSVELKKEDINFNNDKNKWAPITRFFDLYK